MDRELIPSCGDLPKPPDRGHRLGVVTLHERAVVKLLDEPATQRPQRARRLRELRDEHAVAAGRRAVRVEPQRVARKAESRRIERQLARVVAEQPQQTDGPGGRGHAAEIHRRERRHGQLPASLLDAREAADASSRVAYKSPVSSARQRTGGGSSSPAASMSEASFAVALSSAPSPFSS